MMTMRPRPTMLVLLAAALSALAGCGYNNSGGDGSASSGYQWKSVYRQDIRSVAVPIFKSTVYQRGVEFSLSKALVQQIEANTPYKVVPRERADTILEGEIIAVDVHTLSNDRLSAIPQEQLLDIIVDFTWKDLRTGKILVNRRGVEQTATFYPTLGEGRATGTQAATDRLALSIVQELQADW
jgi:hypothetical protein